MNNISIRSLRENLASIANKVSEGQQFAVYRRSKPAFKIVPIDTPIDDQWEMVMDFTEGGKTQGVEIGELLDLAEKEWTK